MRRHIILYCLLAAFLIIGCGKSEESEIKVQKLGDVSEKEKQQRENPPAEKHTGTEVPKLTPYQAAANLDKYVKVEGFVADVFRNKKVAYLNFIERYPKTPFTAVIFADKFYEFGDLSRYRNKTVLVTGTISEFRKKPQMILNSPDQIQIIK